MNYINYAKKINNLLKENISLVKKFDLCVIQRYFIKKFLKKLQK